MTLKMNNNMGKISRMGEWKTNDGRIDAFLSNFIVNSLMWKILLFMDDCRGVHQYHCFVGFWICGSEFNIQTKGNTCISLGS